LVNRISLRTCAFPIVLSICLTAPSQITHALTAHLVRDINSQTIGIGSNPTNFTDQSNWSLFSANDGVHGFEPWVTDGTPAGTFLMGDLTPGNDTSSTGYAVYYAGGHSFTFQNANPGTTIWITDGTPAGSHMLTTLPGGIGVGLGALGSRLLFSVFDAGNYDLWATDGTVAGTLRVPSASGLPFSVGYAAVIANGKLYFLNPLVDGTFEPWVSDGTTAGTVRLGQIPDAVSNGLTPANLVRVGNYLLFTATTSDTGCELWRIDLGTGAISQVQDIAPGAGSSIGQNSRLASTGSFAIFTASVTGDSNISVWRSDGTAAGTFQVSSVVPATNQNPIFLGSGVPGTLLFFVPVGDGNELWATDGTVAGTVRIAPVGALAATFLEAGGHYYFQSGGSTAQFWRTDGTVNSTHLVTGLPPNENVTIAAGNSTTVYMFNRNASGSGGGIYRYDPASSTVTLLSALPNGTDYLVFAQNKLYFDSDDGTHGLEPWVSDGTSAGTMLLKNIAPENQNQASSPADFTSYRGQLYFTADDGMTGREVWHSDGSASGTQELIDANAGSAGSFPSDLFVANGSLYFFATDASGVSHLWRSDGTTAGTAPLAAVSAAHGVGQAGDCDSKGVVMGGSIYFPGYDSVNGAQLWKTDGTASGTSRVSSVAPLGGPFRICYLIAQGNLLYFQSGAADAENLWISDGTSAGTVQIALPTSGGLMAHEFTSLNNALYFVAVGTDAFYQLWTSNGTTSGTNIPVGFNGGFVEDIQAPVAGRLLVAVAVPNSTVAALWSSDGTSAGSQQIAQVLAGRSTFANNGLGFFSGATTVGGVVQMDPWVTDGTAVGTHILLSVFSPTGATDFINFNGVTYFQSTNASHAPILWRTDGTPAGTVSAAALSLGVQKLAVGQNLFYVGNDGSTGDELWALTKGQPIAADDSLGSVQAGTSATVNVLANDSDPDGILVASSVSIVTPPQHGTAVTNSSGIVTYSAQAGYVGADSFSYTVADQQGAVSAPASVQIDVTAPMSTAPPPGTTGGGGGGGGSLGATYLYFLALFCIATALRGRKSVRRAPISENNNL
jgi:ELWxxDGT repeat protein